MHTVYVIQSIGTKNVKIGFTCDLNSRLRALGGANAEELALIHSFEYETEADARIVERLWHKGFSELRISGEWFLPAILEKIADIGKVDPTKARAWLYNRGLMPRVKRRFVIHPTTNKRVCLS